MISAALIDVDTFTFVIIIFIPIDCDLESAYELPLVLHFCLFDIKPMLIDIIHVHICSLLGAIVTDCGTKHM